jgi:hypothetical protein
MSIGILSARGPKSERGNHFGPRPDQIFYLTCQNLGVSLTVCSRGMMAWPLLDNFQASKKKVQIVTANSNDLMLIIVIHNNKNEKRTAKRMNPQIKTHGKTIMMSTLVALAIGISLINVPTPLVASGGTGGSGGSGGGGGGGSRAASFSGNWSGTITTTFGTGAFTMGISQSTTTVSGSVHFGAPIFDATLKLAGVLLDASDFLGAVSNGEGSLPITGVLSADGTTITGTVTQGQVYTYTVTRQ